MNSKRPYRGEEWDTSDPKRLRRVDVTHNDGDHDGHSSLTHDDYTIAWICALPLELRASRAMLDEEHQLLPIPAGDDNTYVLGRVGQHNVAMACLPGEYGTNNAAIVATNLKRSFPRIRATLMVGIGGGSPSQADLRLGDVVVGTRVMQYDMGKVTVGGNFQETAVPKTPAPLLNSAVSTLRSKHSQHDSSSRMISLLQSRRPNLWPPNHPDRLFQASYEHPLGAPTCVDCDVVEKLQQRKARVSEEPKIHYGVIASGNRVMKDGKARDEVARRFSALCFEMEAAGMMDNLQCLPIRGICDYSDSHKSKEWQDYAAATAAAYATELVEELPHLPREHSYSATCFSRASKPDAANLNTERRQQLLETLSFPQIDVRKTAIGAAHTKTCRWLLQHSAYQDWLDPENQSQNHGFLWMRGKAGAGKSTMMKFLFMETKKKYNKPNMATASFFFNARGDYLEKSITGMYRSLLLQLLKTFPDLQSVLDDTDIVPWSQQDCPDLNILKALLRGTVMSLGQRSFTCFIDALDECDEQEVRDMVHFFEDLTENTTNDSIQFRICFSSRPYPYIDIHRGILLTLEKESGHADDLAQYVKSHLKIRNPSLFIELQAKILDKADGIFMWIVLVVEILNKENSHGSLALRRRISEIPAKLSDLFKSILTRDQERPEWLLLCVLWVLCAKRPLSPAEFRHALWSGLLEQDLVDPDLPDDEEEDAVSLVTSSSKGLAEVTKSKEPKVQFIHQSVPDFLVKEKGLQDMWPELGFDWEGPSHERLKHCCTKYLFLPGVQMLLNGPKEGEERDAETGKYSFLEYASQHVLHHANVAALVVPQDDFLSWFFVSAGVRVINLFEGRRTRRYSPHVTPLYVLADKGLGHLIRTQMKRESPAYAPQETYGYPVFAALANGHKDAVATLLGLSSTTCGGVELMEGLKYRKDLKEYKGRTPLSWAAQEGRLSIVKALAQGGAETNERDRQSCTPLLRASQGGHEAVARLLIEKGADINTQNKDGSTALILALQRGHEAVARLLIEKGAHIKAQDKSMALIRALQREHEAVARLLIEKGADIKTQDKSTALIRASQQGHEAVVRLLIEKGADINTQDMFGSTALILALQRGHEAVARLLIENGADINAQDNTGSTAPIWASKEGHEAVARLLIEKGADINTQNNSGSTALIWASRQGHEAVARLLIEKGADINTQDKDGSTALILASQQGYEAVARLLIEKGADINTQDKDGSTALTLALQRGHEAVARLLIEKGADINTQDKSTALIRALQRGHEAVARLLIEKGADINTQDKSTALIRALQRGHEAVARLLIEKGADINTQNNSGSTALIWASRQGHEAVARLLIEKGADINTQDKDGSTALIWASRQGHEAVVRLLIEKGADINTQDKDGSTALILASQQGYEAVVRLLRH